MPKMILCESEAFLIGYNLGQQQAQEDLKKESEEKLVPSTFPVDLNQYNNNGNHIFAHKFNSAYYIIVVPKNNTSDKFALNDNLQLFGNKGNLCSVYEYTPNGRFNAVIEMPVSATYMADMRDCVVGTDDIYQGDKVIFKKNMNIKQNN